MLRTESKMCSFQDFPMFNTWPKVILFGDSLTQQSFDAEGCWGAKLAARLQRKADVMNRGFSGYNTRWCMLIQARLFDSINMAEVAAVVICLGANDSWSPAPIDAVIDQHVPLSSYEFNLYRIVDYFLSRGLPRQRLVLVTPPPYVRNAWCLQGSHSQDKTNETVALYARSASRIAYERHVHLVDAYEEFIKQPHFESLFRDGLHFSMPGAMIFEAMVGPLIERLVDLFRGTNYLNMPPYTHLTHSYCARNLDPEMSNIL